VPESLPPSPDALGPQGRTPHPELVPGRGRLRDYALLRLKRSRTLQISMVIAVLCYGAIPFLVVYPDTASPRLQAKWAAMIVLMSLASWSLLFWWYPVLEATEEHLGDDARGRTISTTLEVLAIGCVAIVHALMAFIVLSAGISAGASS
jgi:hypothetical protein